MRLLQCDNGKFSLTKDLNRDIPKYAILSHTWGPDEEEVTYRDIVDGTGVGNVGYEKLRFCAKQSARDGLRYFWIDTCCIDKSNNTELQEAINSMFRWYQNAARCYVYLTDATAAATSRRIEVADPIWESEFRNSRWFTRGWTLQELLAPASVEFFTRDGLWLGDKRSLNQQIHEITGIAVPALRGAALSEFDDEERFRWAEGRQTTREEDGVYCLLGIFGVHMSLIYGEQRPNALRRLKEAIEK
ncbi:heterokaryon incompatibility protein-domain-containing protein, partial [Bombardia bombarda]